MTDHKADLTKLDLKNSVYIKRCDKAKITLEINYYLMPITSTFEQSSKFKKKILHIVTHPKEP
jgi:hypothetical protein